MATEKRLWTKQSIINLTAKYGIVKVDNVGDTMQHTVESVSSAFDVQKKDGTTVMEFGSEDTVLQKKIVTFKAITELGHRFHKAKLREAQALEAAGDAEGASELYQQYLNGARLSASILSTYPSWNIDLVRGDKVKVDIINFEDKLLKGDNVRVMPAVKAASVGNLFTSLFDGEDEEEDVETETEDEKKPAAKGKVPAEM